VQTHLRAMAVRRSIVADFANEGLATLLKTMIQTGLRGTGPVQFRFAARPQVREADLTALWASLVEPLKRPERCPGAWRGLSWSLYRALVLEQALDPDDPGPFNVRMRAQLLAAYETCAPPWTSGPGFWRSRNGCRCARASCARPPAPVDGASGSRP
jgi:hypothetical protein